MCSYVFVWDVFSSFKVDPTNQGSVGALDAAKFLKKSGLPDAVLSKVRQRNYIVMQSI